MEHLKITCPTCNCSVSKTGYKKHLQTAKHIKGAGLMDLIKSGMNKVTNIFSKRMGFNNISTSTLNKFGNNTIVGIQIARQPIHKVLDTVVNFMSLGKWADLKKKYGYDQLMHLGMIVKIRLDDGTNRNIMIEKVDAVTISPTISMVGNNVEYFDVPLNGVNTNINDMIGRARQAVGDKMFFDYSGLGIGNQPPNNCQYFLLYLLKNSNLLTEPVKNFILQNLEELAKEMPSLTKRMMNTVTDLGQIANKIMGKGKPHRIHIKKSVPYEEAYEMAKQIVGKGKLRYSQTKTLHKFLHKPKTKFQPDTLNKHKLNKKVTIIMGELK